MSSTLLRFPCSRLHQKCPRARFNLQNTSRPRGAMRRGLPDHLGRLEEEGWRNRQTELLGRLEIDDQLERRRLLDGQISRLDSFEQFIDIIGGTFETLRIVGGIRQEAAGLDEVTAFGH
jgi:hypothetical protein